MNISDALHFMGLSYEALKSLPLELISDFDQCVKDDDLEGLHNLNYEILMLERK